MYVEFNLCCIPVCEPKSSQCNEKHVPRSCLDMKVTLATIFGCLLIVLLIDRYRRYFPEFYKNVQSAVFRCGSAAVVLKIIYTYYFINLAVESCVYLFAYLFSYRNPPSSTTTLYVCYVMLCVA